MARYAGHRVFLQLDQETTWGTAANFSAGVLHIPGRGDDFYTVREIGDREIMNTNVGHGRPWMSARGIRRVNGNFNTFGFPDSAKELIEWGSLISSNALPSYTAKFYDVNRSLQHTGLMVRQLSINTGAEIGVQRMQLGFQLVGKAQTSIADPTETCPSEDEAYLFKNAAVHFDGEERTTVRSFSLSFDNTIDEGVGQGDVLQWADFTGRVITGSMVLAVDSPNFVSKFEGDTRVDLYANFLHPKSGSYDLNLDLKTNVELYPVDYARPLGGITLQTVNFTSLLTSCDGSDFSVTLSEGSSSAGA